MSIKVMTRVWDESKQKGTNLVALLAIADHADDYGVAWPGLALIAKKARVQKRQAINLVERLEASGELIVIHQRGRERSNRYLITLGLSGDEIENILDTHPELQVDDWRDSQDKGAKDCTLSTRKGEENCTISRRKGAKDCTNNNEEKVQFSEEKVQFSAQKGAIAIAPEPSINHQSESTNIITPHDGNLDHAFGQVCVHLKNNGFYLGSALASELNDLYDEIKPPPNETKLQWFNYAIKEAMITANKPQWRLVRKILNDISETGSVTLHEANWNGAKTNGHKSTGKSASRANGSVGRKQKGQGGIPALETHSRYEYRADLATGENYWYDSETNERLNGPPPGMP